MGYTLSKTIVLNFRATSHPMQLLHSDPLQITNTSSHTQGINPSLISSLNNKKIKYKTMKMTIRINRLRLQPLLLPWIHITFKVLILYVLPC